MPGEGETGTRGGPPGNLYVVLSAKSHRYFRRQDHNIILELAINVAQAALGDEVMVPTLEGEERLVISVGTQTGKVFRLRGHGVPYLRRNGRGDQLVLATAPQTGSLCWRTCQAIARSVHSWRYHIDADPGLL